MTIAYAPSSLPSSLAPVQLDRLEVERIVTAASSERRVVRDNTHLAVLVFSGCASIRSGPSVAEGAMLIVGPSQSVVEFAPHTDAVILSIPDALAGPNLASLAGDAGYPLQFNEGSAALLAQLVVAIVDRPGGISTGHPARLAQVVIEIVGLVCLDSNLRDDTSWRATLLRSAMDYIEVHLGDLDLAPDRIAREIKVSTRTLHRLFEREGLTINGWTRRRRLENCRQSLLDLAMADVPVGAIGTRWGLWDAAHFSRLFKSEFGMSPRAYRAHASGLGSAENTIRQSH